MKKIKDNCDFIVQASGCEDCALYNPIKDYPMCLFPFLEGYIKKTRPHEY